MNKRLFNDKKLTKKSVIDFLEKRGFYVVLALCIVIVGAVAIFVTTYNMGSPEEKYDAENFIPEEFGGEYALGPGEIEADESSIDTGEEDTPVIGPRPIGDEMTEQGDSAVVVPDADNSTLKADNNQNANTGNNQPAKAEPSPKAVNEQKFIVPVFGEMVKDYAKDQLAYCKTMKDWRTHSGIDIAAERGTPVKAVADGVVVEIIDDARLGIVVVIDHENGYKTLYGNLAADNMVSPNKIVKQGEIIGCVGDTAAFESLEQDHLHFEVFKNNIHVDPKAKLPELK